MKRVLVFVFLLVCIHVSAQITKVGDCKVSPDGKMIAFICYMGMQQDIFLYSLQRDTLIQLTHSANLDFDAQYKKSLNWLDDHRILFLSKHNGLVQQYILDILTNTLKTNGSSASHEYWLKYSGVNDEVYYISSRRGSQPAVFRKKMNAEKEMKVSKGNINCILSSISPNGEYLTYKEMPFGKTVLVSLKDNKIIKSKLPAKNTNVLAWAPSSEEFIYTHGTFVDDDVVKIELVLYNIVTQVSETIVKDVDYISGCVWAPSKDKYLYTLLEKSYLVDHKSKETKEYDVFGSPKIWLRDEKSILFVQDARAYIFNLSDKSIKRIIN